jgi:heme exporter protein B
LGVKRIVTVIQRDLRLAWRHGSDSLTVVAFFVLTVTLFPFGLGPESNLLERTSAGILWVTALLASMLSLDRLFLADYEDGSLELLTLTPTSLELLVIGKVVAHWLTTGLPVMAAAPLLALLLHLQADGFATLMLTLLLGTPTLSLIGAMGAALVLGARRGGVLLSLLVLPLAVPVLIFAVGAVDAAVQGLPTRGDFLILGGLLLAALPLAPLATVAGLRQAVQ